MTRQMIYLSSEFQPHLRSTLSGFMAGDLVKDERGLLMPLVLATVVIGMTLIIPLLGFVSTGLKSAQETTEDEFAYYAADAGVEAVLSDLREGNDPLDDPSYVMPSPTLNTYTAVVTVVAPPRSDMLPFGAVFVDPESATSLSPLAAGAEFEYQVHNVAPFADFQMNWEFTPSGKNWKITVYEGAGTSGSLLENAAGNGSPARVTVDSGLINGGTYTIVFKNNSPDPITSAEFSSTGEPDKTWVRITAFKDYLITSTAGPITLTVFARQGPGPNQVSSSVHIATWHGPN